MTTTAFDDQFTDAPESVHQPYSTADILRRNVADLELALKQQTERAEKAEAELAKLRKQEPVAIYDGVEMSRYTLRWTNGPIPVDTNLYTNPIPAPAVPEEWREVMAELAADLQACIEAEHAYRDQYSSVMRKYQNDMRIVEQACALLQSAPTGEPK